MFAGHQNQSPLLTMPQMIQISNLNTLFYGYVLTCYVICYRPAAQIPQSVSACTAFGMMATPSDLVLALPPA